MPIKSLSGAIAAIISMTMNPSRAPAEALASAVGIAIPEANTQPELSIVEHVTARGKTLRGVVRTDLSKDQAQAIDAYTFRKDGGWFIREKHLEAMTGVQVNPASASVEQAVQKAPEQTEEQKQAIAREQAAARQEQARMKAADRLRAVADKMLADAESELGRDRNTNTARRARMAGSAIREASHNSAIAKTIGNLADAIAAGQADKLAGLTSRTQVEMLDSLLKQAQYDRWRSEGKNYAETERLKGEPLTERDIDYVKFPQVSIHRNHASDIASALAGKKGYTKASAWAYSKGSRSFGSDSVYILDPSEIEMARTVLKGLDVLGKKQMGWNLTDGLTRVDRMNRMGIKNTNDLHAALKEYLQFRDGGIKEDPVKAAERKLVGQKVGIDFFPTPKSLAQRMVELAGIKKGDRVLEPSAGSGNIADAAKTAGADVDTIEVSSQLRELLGLKGHNLIGHDFEVEDYTGRYYDAVLMNPPFSDRKDALHIMRAFDLLKKGGTLVAIAGEGVFFGSDAKAVGFREWLKEHRAHIEKLPEGTFLDKSLLATTGANARLIVMTRKTATGEVTSDDHLQDGNGTAASEPMTFREFTDDSIPIPSEADAAALAIAKEVMGGRFEESNDDTTEMNKRAMAAGIPRMLTFVTDKTLGNRSLISIVADQNLRDAPTEKIQGRIDAITKKINQSMEKTVSDFDPSTLGGSGAAGRQRDRARASEARGIMGDYAKRLQDELDRRGVKSAPQPDPGFSLTTQTEEELRAKEAADKAAQAKEEQERLAAERKAQADREAADFKLTGSDRPADIAMAAGQGDLFAPKTRGQKEAEKNRLGLHVIESMPGKFVYVGNVPDELAYEDGYSKEKAENARQFGERFGPKKRQPFASWKEAADFAATRGYQVIGDDPAATSAVAENTKPGKTKFTYAIKRDAESGKFYIQSDDGGGVVLAGKPGAFGIFDNTPWMMFGTEEDARRYLVRKGMTEAEKATSTASSAGNTTAENDNASDVIVDDELLEIGKRDTAGAHPDVRYAMSHDQQGVMPGKLTYLNEFVKNGKVTLSDVAEAWAKTRDYIRRKHGNVVGLYRADAPKSEHHPDTTILFMGDKKLAARFALDGRKLKRFRVRVDDILGLNVTRGGYYEFLVKKPSDAGDAEIPENSGDDMDPNSPNYRYRDTGYIADSRKEKAKDQIRASRAAGQMVGFQMIDWEAIEENPRAAKELITKSNLFGKVDWDALKAGGMTAEAGFLIDRIYASIGTEPGTDGPMGRKDYAIGIQSIRDRLEKCKTAEDVLNVLAEIRDEFQGTTLNADEAAQVNALRDESAVIRKKILALEAEHRALKDSLFEARRPLTDLQREQEKRARRGWKPDPEIAAKIAPAEAVYKDAEKALQEWEAAHPEIMDTYTSEKTADGGLRGSFRNPLKDEYRGYYQKIREIEEKAKKRNLLENQATRSWLSFGSKFFGVLNYRSARNGSDAFAGHVVNAMNNRVGGWDWAEKERAKPVKQATKEEVRFQLRVVDNYQRIGGRPVAAKSTQDLKDTFGFRDVQSGNWVLKDPASARFHVEQTAGAMDDMGDILGIPPSVLGLGGRLAMAFGARGSGAKGWKDSAPRAHYEPVQRVINLTKMGGGGCLGHEYFHALDNMLGELVNQKVSDKKDDMVTMNPDLLPPGKIRSAVSDLRMAMVSGTKRLPETFKITPRDRALAKANLERQYLGSFQKSIKDAGSAEAAVAVVRARYIGTDNKRMLKQRDDWIRIAVAYFTPGDKESVTLGTGPYGSDFQIGALELDAGQIGKYWSKPEEMAARAFQAYLEDRMADAGRRNDYLSAMADNKYHVDPLFGIEWKPFPEGEERKRINAAFDKLFEVIRGEQILEKAAANKPLMDAMFPGFDPDAELTDIIRQMVA